MKALMYHYVRPASQRFPYFRHLQVEDFRRQLDWFQEHDSFIDRDAFLSGIKNDRSPQRGGIILTFDDGLWDHYAYVFPELQRRGLWGIFCVPTGFHTTAKPLAVHVVHYLLGRWGGRTMLEALQREITDDMLCQAHVNEFRNRTYLLQDNDQATAQFKRVLNYFISYSSRKEVLNRLVEQFATSEEISHIYMPPERIRELHEADMIIGSHSVTHPVFSKLSACEQEWEIRESYRVLDEMTGGLEVRTFCYPYGGFHTFTAETKQILTRYNTQFSFNVEPRDLEWGDVLQHPQVLPRYDCNLFPFGQCCPIPVAQSADVCRTDDCFQSFQSA